MKLLFKSLLLFVVVSVFWSCTEKIDTSSRYVYKEKTIMGYLRDHEAYSSYVALLAQVDMSRIEGVSKTKVAQLLDARGNYTVFAPTNEAIHKYLESLVEDGLIDSPSWDSFTDARKQDSIRKVIVYNSIIDGHDEMDSYFYTSDFPHKQKKGNEIELANLNDKKITVEYSDKSNDSIYVMGDCAISSTERDIVTLNGIIHQVNKVLATRDISARNFIVDYINERLHGGSRADVSEDGFLVMFRAIQACGLLDTLSAIRDERYEELYQRGKIENLNGMTGVGFAEGSIAYAPEHRKYGFTIFAETDNFWRENGLDPKSGDLLADLVQWIKDNHQYSEGDVFTELPPYNSEKSLLYQWVTYHMLPMKIPVGRLVFHHNEKGFALENPGTLTIPVYEYYTTMGKRRLFKLYESSVSNGVYINRFPIIDNERTGTGYEIGCEPQKVGAHVGEGNPLAIVANDIENCCVYPIDAPISYNDDVRDNLQKERIRFDGMSLFPEAMNNDIRLKHGTEERYKHVLIPNTLTSYNYFENMKQNEDMKFVYYNAWNDDWCNLHRDEMKAVGRYEVMFTLPPVPRRGTYEVRYKVLANGNRGIAQIYFGTDPDNLPVAGIPIDLTMGFNSTRGVQRTGWEQDTEDQDYNAEVDKRLRNNGYMKGPHSIDSKDGTEREYNDRENIRHIFIRQTMDPDKTYYIKLKSVLESNKKEFYMDFMEYCSKEVYDNPEVPEDIW